MRILPITISVLIILAGFKVATLHPAFAASKTPEAHAAKETKKRRKTNMEQARDRLQKIDVNKGDIRISTDQDAASITRQIQKEMSAPLTTSKKDKIMGQFSFEPSEVELLQALVERRGALNQKEKTLAERGMLLKAAEKRIDQKIKDLAEIKGQVKSLLDRFEGHEEEKLRSLVSIYEKMKAKSAANIFNKMDDVVLLNLFSRMREQKSAEILAKMNASKSRQVTALLAAAGDRFREEAAKRLRK
ncbi:MAG: MotE family protein [Alphaproteobacteria bacterium]